MSVHTLITGAGGITPMGQTQQELVDNLKAETSNISPMAILSKNLKASFWSPCVFNLKEDSPARDLPKSVYNDTLAISYVSILRALADAGLGLEVFASERTALVSAMGATGIDGLHSLLGYREKRTSPFALLKSIPTAVTGPLTALFNIRGPVHTVQHACASGVRTVTQAMDLIELGKADVVVCVSAEKILGRPWPALTPCGRCTEAIIPLMRRHPSLKIERGLPFLKAVAV